MGRRCAVVMWSLVGLAALVGCGRPLAPAHAGEQPAPSGATAASTVAVGDLPEQAVDTLRAIDRGPPYPFRRDGITFHNREGRLPHRPDGYYREFTVVTPRAPDRGPRRVITGAGGERYYTADHYRTFREITR